MLYGTSKSCCTGRSENDQLFGINIHTCEMCCTGHGVQYFTLTFLKTVSFFQTCFNPSINTTEKKHEKNQCNCQARIQLLAKGEVVKIMENKKKFAASRKCQ